MLAELMSGKVKVMTCLRLLKIGVSDFDQGRCWKDGRPHL